MSHPSPHNTDPNDHIDWDSFLDMDMVDNPSHPTRQANPFPLLPQQQNVNPAEASRLWPQIPEADMLDGSTLYDPYIFPPPSRPMHMIEEMLEESTTVDFPDLPPLEIGIMSRRSYIDSMDMERRLRSHVRPTFDSDVQLPETTFEAPYAIDPALTDQVPSSLIPNPSTDWEEHPQPAQNTTSTSRPLLELQPDFHLHATLQNHPTHPPRPEFSPRRRNPKAPPNSSHLPHSSPQHPLPSHPSSSSPSSSTPPFTPQPTSRGPCLTCGKNYRTTTSPGRCTRCGLKWERSTALPPTYTLDPLVPDLAAAREILFPMSRGKPSGDPDPEFAALMQEPGIEDFWVGRFLAAICTPVVQGPQSRREEEEGGGKDLPATTTWCRNQQRTFNQKSKMERSGDFSPAALTARLRALWWEVVVFHGGGRSLYPVGGDSAGYAEDGTMGFRERLEAVEQVLRVDKRTVMDVVEGRGVGGFVGNPWGFHKRKDSNNGCNIKKKDVLKRHRGDSSTGNRGRKKTSRNSSVGVERGDDEGDEDNVAVEMRE